MGRKRPCSVCGCWFWPDARVRKSQRTCGLPACRREQRRRTQKAYRDGHEDYWSARRLRSQAARAAASGVPAVGPPPASMARVPWDLAQDALGTQGAVLMGFFVRLAIRSAKDAMSAQVLGITEEVSRLRAAVRQDATDEGVLDHYRPP